MAGFYLFHSMDMFSFPLGVATVSLIPLLLVCILSVRLHATGCYAFS